MSYRLELAKTDRSGCCNTECKKSGDKIAKGTLRHGVMVTIKDHQSWKWRHWGCVTPSIISNMRAAIDDNYDYLDGYDELPGDLQEIVRKAFEQGHVDDENWRGDVEQNRPGASKSFRSPAAKKKKKKAAAETAELENEDGAQSPAKPAPKKRGRTKKNEDLDDVDAQEPPAKKTKAGTKKEKKVKDEEDSDVAAAGDLPAKKSKSAAKGAKKAQDATDLSELDEAPPPKKARGRKKKVEVEKDQNEPLLKGGESDHDIAPVPAKKSRAPKKAAATKVESDEDEEAALVEEEMDIAQEPKRGRKKAVEKESNKTATTSKTTNGVGRKGARSKKA